jgi:hypothetical protein
MFQSNAFLPRMLANSHPNTKEKIGARSLTGTSHFLARLIDLARCRPPPPAKREEGMRHAFEAINDPRAIPFWFWEAQHEILPPRLENI